MFEPSTSKVRFVGEPQAVPVFNCRVIVSPPDAAGLVMARSAELEGLSVTAASQREALQKLVAAFKTRIAEYVARQEEIPWIRPGEKAQAGEQELFIAVHL